MKLKRKILIIFLAVATGLCLTGAAFSTTKPKMNIDKNPVYARCDICEVIKAAKSDYSKTSEAYKAVDIIDTGVVKSIEKNQKSLTVTFENEDVKVNTEQKSEVAKLSIGSNVTVYGQFKFESEKNKTVSITADHLINETVKLSFDNYVYGGKRGYNEKDSRGISLAKDRIQFMIPNEWLGTEAEGYDKIFNSKIYNDNAGKCYYINRALGGNEPEVFCIFYFDNNAFLEKTSDKSKTRDIEVEIINNICPDEKDFWNFSQLEFIFPTEESTSSKGVEFDHYVANYDNYRIEFAFTPVKGLDTNDNGGICVMLHMYIDDSIRPDDVLYVMSTLSVNK